MRKALFSWLYIITSVAFLFLSIYLWLCLGVSLRYDMYGFDYSDWNYDLIEWINKLFGLSLLLIVICLIVSRNWSITERKHKRAAIFILSIIVLYDLFTFVAAFFINKYLLSVKSIGFFHQFFCYVAPLLLLFNILTIIVSSCLLFLKAKMHGLFRVEGSKRKD